MRAARSILWVAMMASEAGGPHQLRQRIEDMLGGVQVKVPGRLVGQQDARGVGNCTSNRHALLFAAGKLGRSMIETSTQAQIFEQFNRPCLRFRTLEAADHLRQQHVFECGEFRQQMVGLDRRNPISLRRMRVRS